MGKYSDIYEQQGYSKMYGQQIDDLKIWFVDNFPIFRSFKFKMTTEELRKGIDFIPSELQVLTKRAFDVWLKEKNYELSYNQMCIAFFDAARQTNMIDIFGNAKRR